MSPRPSMRLRLLWRAMQHRPVKFLSILGALVVGATLASAFLSIFLDLPAKMTREFRTLGPNLIVSPLAEESTFAEEIPAGIGERFPAIARLPWLYAVARAGEADVILGGTDPAGISTVHPTWTIDGSASIRGGAPLQWTDLDSHSPAPPASLPWLVAGSEAAQHLGWTPGETVAIEYGGNSIPFLVRGTISTGRSEDSQLLVQLSVLQSITGNRGRLSLVELVAGGDPARIESLRREISSAFPAAQVRPLRPVVESEAAVVMKVRNLMLGLTLIVLALVLLSVMMTISGMVLDSSREIGVMKALGAREWTITRQLLGETASLAFAAALGGYGIGFILARLAAERIFGSGVDLRADVLAAVVGITVAVALLATLLPARWIRRLDPAVILRGE